MPSEAEAVGDGDGALFFPGDQRGVVQIARRVRVVQVDRRRYDTIPERQKRQNRRHPGTAAEKVTHLAFGAGNRNLFC